MARLAFLGETVRVRLDRARGTVRVGEAIHVVTLEYQGSGALKLEIDGRRIRAHVARVGDDIFVHARGASWIVRAAEDGAGAASADSAGSGRLEAPMPGTVVSVEMSEGDEVEHGAPIMTIESMKLQTVVRAPYAGTLTALKVAAGDTFDKGALLAEIGPED